MGKKDNLAAGIMTVLIILIFLLTTYFCLDIFGIIDVPENLIKEGRKFFIVKLHGDKVEKMFRMTNFQSDEGIQRFITKLRKMGIDDELEKMQIEEGDIVRILDFEFEYTK